MTQVSFDETSRRADEAIQEAKSAIEALEAFIAELSNAGSLNPEFAESARVDAVGHLKTALLILDELTGWADAEPGAPTPLGT